MRFVWVLLANGSKIYLNADKICSFWEFAGDLYIICEGYAKPIKCQTKIDDFEEIVARME